MSQCMLPSPRGCVNARYLPDSLPRSIRLPHPSLAATRTQVICQVSITWVMTEYKDHNSYTYHLAQRNYNLSSKEYICEKSKDLEKNKSTIQKKYISFPFRGVVCETRLEESQAVSKLTSQKNFNKKS